MIESDASMKPVTAFQPLHLPRHYLQHLMNLVQSRGGDPTLLLQEAEGTPNDLEQTDAPLSWQQFSSIISKSCEVSQEPALGLYLGSQLTITTHGLLGVAAMSSQNLQQALSLLCHYTVLRNPLLAVSMQLHNQHLHLKLTEVQPLGSIRQFVVEAFTVALHAILDFVSDHRYRLVEVHLAYPEPAYSALYQAFFPCPLVFNQASHSLVLNRSDLAIASPWSDPQLQQKMTSECEFELQRWQQQQSVTQQIQRMLARTKGRIPCIEQVAKEFAVSSRTLRRRLAAEHTHYQQLVDTWRRQMACHYLTSTQLSMQQIAYLLGYADPANFGRAFRRQAGMSPMTYRQQQEGLRIAG